MPQASRFLRKQKVQQPQMEETYHQTPKMNQATVETSSVLRDCRAALCLGNLQHPENSGVVLQIKSRASSNTFSVSLPTNNLNFPGTTETRMNAQILCITTGMTQAVSHNTGSPAPNLKLSGQRSVQYFNVSFLSEWT